MASKPDLWMPVYIGDYLAATTALNTTEHGAYFLLMMHAWKNGGVLPKDPDRLRIIARATAVEWETVWSSIQGYFDLTEDGYVQKRLCEEMVRAKALINQKSLAGKASAAQRKLNKTRNGKSTDSSTGGSTKGLRNSIPSQSPSQSPSESPAPQPSPEGKTGTARPKPAARAWPEPPGVSPEAWKGYLEVRTKKRSSLTDFAYKGICDRLAAMANPDAAIRKSAEFGWLKIVEDTAAPASSTWQPPEVRNAA